ncbi:hypothetical protein HU200_004838 [Digitaria exilis]|uniref:Fe2OG dioxygenase domain-containing protein n=1 Tax=Digitaria exilis TaxID=1010633 RepID=A0A835FTB9_9POAL|nr:hypothetical protein HU200_004838 [Digitaria exilis]
MRSPHTAKVPNHGHGVEFSGRSLETVLSGRPDHQVIISESRELRTRHTAASSQLSSAIYLSLQSPDDRTRVVAGIPMIPSRALSIPWSPPCKRSIGIVVVVVDRPVPSCFIPHLFDRSLYIHLPLYLSLVRPGQSLISSSLLLRRPYTEPSAQMADCMQEWPEPVVRVQALAQSGLSSIPRCYVKPPSDRPMAPPAAASAAELVSDVSIPVIDLGELLAGGSNVVAITEAVAAACREWGFFQVVNHGVRPELMRAAREAWRGFFRRPLAEKQRYANSPRTYEGYGSRLGVQKGAVLDWGDYFFLHLAPEAAKSPAKFWPANPGDCKEVSEEYGREVVRLCEVVMRVLSVSLGLDEEHLHRAFGGAACGATLRANYYPRCPQPDLTLGLSAHSDPGVLTVLLADEHVRGLQVRRGGSGQWVTVQPVRDAFIVNVGDQIQLDSYRAVHARALHVRARTPAARWPNGYCYSRRPTPAALDAMRTHAWAYPKSRKHVPAPVHGQFIDRPSAPILSNSIYKSVEHRVVVNAKEERISLALFYNPKGDVPISPAPELVAAADGPALYPPMTFDEYRLFVRKKGAMGKAQIEALKGQASSPEN